MGTWENLLSWMAQTVAIASAGALLPILLRIRHPRTQLAYCHLVLAACLMLPFLQPWRHPTVVQERLRIEIVSGFGPPPALYSPAPSRTTNAPLARTSPAPPQLPIQQSFPWRRDQILWWTLALGASARFAWLLAGLAQIRKYRIGATPLYPIPDSVHAAASITHADAVFCVSSEVPGPVMLGWLAPVVLLPETFVGLNDEAQCGIACHELLHVRRHDWPVTLLEELVAAVLWFNPGVWWLLAQARLAREQLVDAETVRLTAARESYIDALLAIARQRPVLDLAPAPLFLRRRHLTHRMHLLLKEVPMSKLRLFSSYGSITAILACAVWLVCAQFPLTGQPRIEQADAATPAFAPEPAEPPRPAEVVRNAPLIPPTVAFVPQQVPLPSPAVPAVRRSSVTLPADMHEPVTGGVHTPATAEERASALSLLEFARANGQTHRAGSAPYIIKASFTAAPGDAAEGGSGELTETWLTGQLWRWTATMGNYSVTRSLAYEESSGATHPGAVPMRVHMLRNAIFWAIQQPPGNMQVRTAAIQRNGQPATCILTSRVAAPPDETRLWEEEEYCIDNTTKLLQVQSVAPGTYVVYGYGAGSQFHGRTVPTRITVYVNGTTVLDAQLSIADPGSVDPSTLRPTDAMTARGRVATLDLPTRFPIEVVNASVTGDAKPVIVHASIDGSGTVVEEELSSASDPALATMALAVVQGQKFQPVGVQRQAYINVRFVPAQ